MRRSGDWGKSTGQVFLCGRIRKGLEEWFWGKVEVWKFKRGSYRKRSERGKSGKTDSGFSRTGDLRLGSDCLGSIGGN